MAIASLGYKKQESGTRTDPVQQPFLRDIYGLGQSLYGQTGPAAQQRGEDIWQQYAPGLNAGFATLQGLADPRAQIDAQAASLQAGLGQLFREEINPSIGSGAIGAGGYGGGRHGVAQGVAAGQMGQAFTQGYGDIVGRANAQAGQAAGMMPQFGNQAMNLGLAPYQAAWAPALNYATLVGPPNNQAFSKSTGFDIGFG